jgi:murein DD-endopeptidase MepM/ murein hydrolase activator NlpD
VSSDHTQIAQLEAQINAEGAKVQALVAHYDAIAGELASVNKALANEQVRLASDRRSAARAAKRLQAVAVAAYVNAQFGNSSMISSYTGTGSASIVQVKNVYLGTANGTLEAAKATLTNDQTDVAATEQALKSTQGKVTEALSEARSSKDAAILAVGQSEASLRRVNGHLLALVTAARVEKAAAVERAAERAIAATAAQQSNLSATPVVAVAPSPSTGTYQNPLRSLQGIRSNRIDQGVDFSGFGPVYAIGDGVVVSTVNGGWPAGTFITYRLSDGPAAGLTVFAAENLVPTVSVGQRVTSATQIGNAYEGSYGIEVGWADPAGNGTTMASDYNQFYGSNTTAFGVNFSQLLASLGAPSGSIETTPAGAVPASWPSW